jgi:hypothetical protein
VCDAEEAQGLRLGLAVDRRQLDALRPGRRGGSHWRGAQLGRTSREDHAHRCYETLPHGFFLAV